MNKVLIWVIILTLNLSVLSGCWNRREVEDLAIVSAIGFDIIESKGSQKYRITVQIIRPQALGKKETGGSGAASPVWVETAIGNTINEAVRNFSSRSPRQLFLAHAKIIVFGKSTADHGMHEFLDFMQRQKEIRLRTWLVVSNGAAYELLKIRPTLETLPSTEIVGMFTNTQPNISKSYPIDLKEFTNKVASPGCDPVAALITLNAYGPDQDMKAEVPIGPKKFPRLQGVTVFRGDKRVGDLGDADTMGFLWVTGKMKKGIITLTSENKKEFELSVEITKAHSKITPIIRDNEILIKVEIEAEGDLGECTESKKILQNLPVYEQRYAEIIKNQANDTVKKVQSESYQADIFGFGDTIHRKYPELWREKYSENWNTEYFPEVKVEVAVEAKIRHTGMIANPIPIR